MNSGYKAWGRMFALGIFIVLAVAFVIILLLFLRPTLGDEKQEMRVRFGNIDRIKIGTYVNFAGKPVGEVKKISLIPDFREGKTDKSGNLYTYELLLKVNSDVAVYDTDEVALSTAGLLGERVVAICPRPAAKGAPEARNVTCEVLYANEDKMNELINKFNRVTVTLESTLGKMNSFFDENNAQIHSTLLAMSSLIESANKQELTKKVTLAADRASLLFSNLTPITEQVASKRGTMGGLLYSDALYGQISSTLTRLELLLQDLNDYGFLFQFSSKWQKERKARKCGRPCP